MSETVTAPIFFFDGSRLSDVLYTEWTVVGSPGSQRAYLKEDVTFNLADHSTLAVVELPYGCFVVTNQPLEPGEVVLESKPKSRELRQCGPRRDLLDVLASAEGSSI